VVSWGTEQDEKPTFSKEGNVYLDNLAVEAKDSEKMALDNIPGEIVDDNDLCIGL